MNASPRYIGPPPEVAASAGIARSQPAQQSRHDHRSESIERLPDALRRYRFNAGPAISRRSGSTLAVKSVGSNTDNDIHDNGRIVSVDLESHDELAEIALVVTVDGAIHAIRRDTGLWVWSLHDENESAQTDDIVRSPLVRSSSTSGAGDDSSEHYTDDEVYVIEPHSGGDIYMYHKSTGQMQRLPLSVTQLVDLSPFTFPTDVHSSTEANATSGSSGDGKLFLGRKETKLVGVDISSGKLVGEFGPEAGWCEWPQTRTTSPAASSTIHTDDGEGIEHRPWHLLYIGRTDYHLSIYSKKHGLLQTLSYTAYGPSTLANPSAPHSSSTYSDSPTSLSLDGRYIQPMHDGSLVCFESDRDGLQWSNHFSHPVVSVFDIVHPASAAQSNPASSFTDDGRTRSTSDRPHPRSQPVVVVHPTQILHSSISALRHVPATTYVGRIPTYNINSSARVGEDQFFAMSNDHYPLIAFANPAVPGSGSVDQSDDSAIAHVHGILGVHKIEEPLDSGRTIDPKPEPLGIDAGPSRPSSDETHSKPAVPALPDGTKDSKQLRLGKSLDFRYLLQTATLAVTMACVFLYFRRILRKRQRLSREPRIRYESVSVSKVEKAEPPPSEGSSSASTESIPMHISVKDLPSSSLIASDGTSRHVYSPSIDKALPALPPFEEINENNETDNQALSVTPPMVDSAVDLDSDGEDDDVVKTGNKKKGRRRKRGKRPGQRATDAVASNEAIDGVQARQAAPIAAAIIPKLSPVPVVDIPPPVVDERDGIAGRIGSLIVSEQIIGKRFKCRAGHVP
ncbi:bifunctional endoribonuclease/protein kinase ire1 [Cystobasidiomycetes sp. EMM_F5]